MELKPEEKNILEQVYGKFALESGYIANQIKEVRELSAEENKFFSFKNFISPYFCVQTLYKISGEVSPMKFSRAVKNLLEEDENFRENFCSVGTRTVKIISEKRGTLPEVVFRILNVDDAEELDETLTRIMEADRRRDFDLQRDFLIRFSAFRTAPNESAVLVTMPQLLASRFDSEKFFAAALHDAKYKKVDKPAPIQSKAVDARVKEYWAQVLKDLPAPPKVPFAQKNSGAYREQIFRAKIPADILSDLRVRSQASRAILMLALQTAWGFLLQAANNSSDIAFCRLVKAAGDSSLNLMPVRLTSAKDTTLENLINQQFRQLVVSQPYSYALQDLSLQRVSLFDHFLSFLDFGAEEKFYSAVEAAPAGKIVARNFWDARGMKLGVYFQYAEKNLAVTFQYDANQFAKGAGERLAELYELVLRQMLVYWNAPFSEFMANWRRLASENISSAAEISARDDRKIIADFIYRSEILQGKHTGTAQLFSDAKILARFEGDRLSGDILEKNLVFVVEGKLARSLDTGDGWFNTLDIIKSGGWLNENIFLQKRRATISAEVLTENATLLLIPLTRMEAVLKDRPDIFRAMMSHVLRQMEKYQMLWLQS